MKILKRSFVPLLILCMMVTMIPFMAVPASAASSDGTPSVVVNGENVNVDVPPFISNGRTFVPVALVVNYLGGKSDWEASTSTVKLSYGDTHITMRIGSAQATVNGEVMNLDAVPRIKGDGHGGGRTMVPIRLISEAFGFTVNWNPDTYQVTINTTGKTHTTGGDSDNTGNARINSLSLSANNVIGNYKYTYITVQASSSLKNIVSSGQWLSNPTRYYIDFANAEYTSSVKRELSQNVSTSNVRSVRTGEPFDNTARLVVDMAEPQEPTVGFSPDGRTMTLSFIQNRSSGTTTSSQTWKAGSSDTTTKQGTHKYDTISQYDPYADGKLVVAIDPGHGTTTGGKRSFDGSLREWEFNRSVAYKLKSRLEARGIQTVMTVGENQTGDPSLANRVAVANANDNVDLFVSVHANAYGSNWNSANGWEVYSYKRGGVSELAAKFVEKATKAAISSQMRDRGAKTANFYVIKNTEMPAILIEHGFYTNASEVELLKSDSFRNELADADCTGIVNFFNSFK